jgi:hypothetical protein
VEDIADVSDIQTKYRILGGMSKVSNVFGPVKDHHNNNVLT